MDATHKWTTYVNRRVALYCYRNWIDDIDRADELAAVGLTALFEYLATKPQATLNQIRKRVDGAICDARQECLFVKPSTRRRRIKRGADPGDLTRHSYSDSTDEYGNHIFWESDDTYQVVLPALSDWLEHLQVPATQDASIRVREMYAAIYSLCQSTEEFMFLESALDRSQLDNITRMHPEDLMPPHDTDIAAEIGLSLYKVKQCRSSLEARIYEYLGERKPTRQRRQRDRRK